MTHTYVYVCQHGPKVHCRCGNLLKKIFFTYRVSGCSYRIYSFPMKSTYGFVVLCNSEIIHVLRIHGMWLSIIVWLAFGLDKAQGWGLLSQFSPFRYFPHFPLLSKQTLAVEYHVYIWQVSPQFSCGDTCQIWMWFKESNRYFCKIENFACGDISEHSFSNPHPRRCAYCMYVCVCACVCCKGGACVLGTICQDSACENDINKNGRYIQLHKTGKHYLFYNHFISPHSIIQPCKDYIGVNLRRPFY